MLEIIPYGGWANACRLSNGSIELIATLDVGPRIIHLGFIGGDNILNVSQSDLGQTGGDEFRFYGGHRLWHAPEAMPRTYAPDNQALAHIALPDGVRLIQTVEASTGIQKEIDIHLNPDQDRVQVHHRLRNAGHWPVQLAPWGITALAAGGTGFIPMSARGDHAANLLPVNSFTVWAYTDLADPRWTIASEYLALRQDTENHTPQKLGLLLSEGWMAYARQGVLFIKRARVEPGATYPDRGSSAEVFTNHEVLELETLGPAVQLEPGGVVSHTETWELHRGEQFATTPDVDRLWSDVNAVVQ
jgi:hypothetical protein